MPNTNEEILRQILTFVYLQTYVHMYILTFLLETYIILEFGISTILDLQFFQISILLEILYIW